MNKKIEIKSISGDVLFTYESEDNTILKTVERAVAEGTNLRFANLSGTDLNGANLDYAILNNADLSGANLNGANLYRASFDHAYLCDANIRGTNLFGASFRGTNLNRACLYGANLCEAFFSYANLSGAYLDEANLSEVEFWDVDLSSASFDGANLSGSILADVMLDKVCLYKTNFNVAFISSTGEIPYIPLSCPSDGSFTGWKRLADFLIQLEIPADAKRISTVSRSCRCSKAKVIDIVNLVDGQRYAEVINHGYGQNTIYRVNEIVYPDSFSEDRWNGGSSGIHFFINKQDAINYF